MNGRLGKKKAKSIKPILRVRLRNPLYGVSFQRRSRRKGAITMAICLTATARPRETQLALGWRYQRTEVRTRKNAHMLSVQLPAITTENKVNGRTLTLLSRAGAKANIVRIDMRWKMKTVSLTSCRPSR